jgi:hypothetical protein
MKILSLIIDAKNFIYYDLFGKIRIPGCYADYYTEMDFILLQVFQYFPVDMRSKYNMVKKDQGSPDEVSGKMKDCRGSRCSNACPPSQELSTAPPGRTGNFFFLFFFLYKRLLQNLKVSDCLKFTKIIINSF